MIIIDELGFPIPEKVDSVLDEQRRRRAFEAYHFFYPTVSMEGIMRGTRATGAVDNQSALLCVAQPRHKGFTLNSDTPYAGGVLDLGAGPMVIEVPAGPLIGLVDDHHHRWVTDLGIPGEDAGHGAKYVIVPQTWEGQVLDGYPERRCDTRFAMVALRALPLGGDLVKATTLLQSVQIYPLDPDQNRSAFSYVDVSDIEMDTTPLAWEDNLEFWRVLHSVIDAEPAIEELRPMLGALAELGIEADHPFQPDPALAGLLAEVARVGRDQMLVSAFASYRSDRLAWPDRRWEWVGLRPENGDFERPGSLDVEARDRWFAQAIVASPAMFRRAVGQGSLYWLAHRDRAGGYLDGSRTYRLEVPVPVPATLFWSVTAYDARTRSEVVAAQGQAALRSLFEQLSPAGSPVAELYFGPEQAPGGEGRWVQTVPGRGWFAYFRIYGPEKSAFDGSWRPGDFEQVESSTPTAVN
jgi:hypothetical protein